MDTNETALPGYWQRVALEVLGELFVDAGLDFLEKLRVPQNFLRLFLFFKNAHSRLAPPPALAFRSRIVLKVGRAG